MGPYRWMSAAFVLLSVPSVFAAPVVIEANLAAVATPRTDTGTGLCATGVHVSVDDRFTSLDIAQGFLDNPTNAQVNGTKSTPYPAINFRNSLATSAGDFSDQASNESAFPFTATQMTPMQPDDNNNFALRVRGYLNVTRTGVHTYAVNADDAFRLSIGGKLVFETGALGTGKILKYSRQVDFQGTGLFPMELIYFQNSGNAVLEMSLSDRPDDTEFGPVEEAIGANFKVLQGNKIYSALVSQSTCAECVADAACGDGKFCRDGLCQRALLSTRCGTDRGMCTAGQPVCTSDTVPAAASCVECGVTATGEINDGVCKAKAQVCDFTGRQCVPCVSDLQCDTKTQICDLAFGQCIARPNLKYSGGCATTGGAGTAATGGAVLLLAAALSFLRRRARA